MRKLLTIIALVVTIISNAYACKQWSADYGLATIGATSVHTYSWWTEIIPGSNFTSSVSTYFFGQPITLDFYDGYSGTDRAGKITIWYTLISE